jgi:adenine-specific DNA-methyltransferase
MATMATRQTTVPDKNYRRTRRLSRAAYSPQKPLYQAVSAHLPRRGRARAAVRFCIKDGVLIDPPYNTGNDFIYPDNYSESLQTYSDTDGRFHSRWMNMMYPRLYLARNLLQDDGVIFISIDDGELINLKKICDEVFGEENFIELIIWKKRSTPPNDKVIGANHDYILIFSKNIDLTKINLRSRSEPLLSNYESEYR